MFFENKILLHLLWVLALQAVMLWFYWQWRSRKLRRLGSPQLEERLLLGFSPTRFWLKNGIFGAVLVLIALGIANPVTTARQTPPPKASADILIALDVSRSMMATDVQPNRLTQAKTLASDLIRALRTERVGLLVFAGDAFPQAPLTSDPDALLLFVRNAAPDAVNDQGTNIPAVISLAQRMLPNDAKAGQALIIISDGENHVPEAAAAAERAAKDGLVIHTISVGTAGGGSIPSATGGLFRDYDGQVVRTRVDEQALREIAAKGGGIAVRAADGDALRQIVTAAQQLKKASVERQSFLVRKSYFQWLILPALLLLIIDQFFRWRTKPAKPEEQ